MLRGPPWNGTMIPEITQWTGLPKVLNHIEKNLVEKQRTIEAEVAEWYKYRIVACLVPSSSPVPLKTRRVGQRCTLNLSGAETSSRWCGVAFRRGDDSSGVVHVP
ncbi:uncharacterized protein TNCV_628891 [Trichonephila clavipes]|nr:uncharacterized protein TNCV_628891 [Trichonephila clavipes]